MAASPPEARSKISDSVFKNPGIYIYACIILLNRTSGKERGTGISLAVMFSLLWVSCQFFWVISKKVAPRRNANAAQSKLITNISRRVYWCH